MSKLIFIGGATAVGKTTVIKKLIDNLDDALYYRRVQGFYDLAELNGIPKEEAFKEVSPIDVDDYFVFKCHEKDIIISDIHYAVQMHRTDENGVNIHDKYVPTVSKGLIKKLMSTGVEIVPILLETTPEISYNRALERYNKKEKEMRNISVEDSKIEILSERKEFLNLAKYCKNFAMLNTVDMDPEELSGIILDIIKATEAKKYVL